MKIFLDNKIREQNSFSRKNTYPEFGFFETVKILNGKAVFLREHYERIKKSSEIFGLKMNAGLPEIAAMADRLISENGLGEGALRILIFKRGAECRSVISTDERKYSPENYKRGMSLKFSKIRKNEASALANHKTTNCFENLREREKALKEGYDDAIFLNNLGYITETASANIFFIKENEIFTPSCGCGILPGIVREKVFHIAKRRNMRLEEGLFKKEDMINSEAVFITNSLMGIMPVRSAGGKDFFAAHPVIKKIIKKYESLIKKSGK